MTVITISCPKRHHLCYFPSSAASHPHKVYPSRSIAQRSLLRGQRSSSAEKPVVLKLVSPADRPPIVTPTLSRGGRKLSNTTENPISMHCHLAPNMITPHSSPAAAAGLGFTALRDCLRAIAPFELIEDDSSVEPKNASFRLEPEYVSPEVMSKTCQNMRIPTKDIK